MTGTWQQTNDLHGKHILTTPAVSHNFQSKADIQTRHGRVLIGMVSFFTDLLRFLYGARRSPAWNLYAAKADHPGRTNRRHIMLDLLYLALGVAAFAAFALGVRAVERM
jgi:hypothetical protein